MWACKQELEEAATDEFDAHNTTVAFAPSDVEAGDLTEWLNIAQLGADLAAGKLQREQEKVDAVAQRFRAGQ